MSGKPSGRMSLAGVGAIAWLLASMGGLAHEGSVEKTKPAEPAGPTQRVIAHPVQFSMDVDGEVFEFQATIAEGIPSAVTIGNEGDDHAYRLEFRTNTEAKTPSGVRFLPIGVRLYLEEPGTRTLIKDVSMGVGVGAIGSMTMGSDSSLIQLEANVMESEEHWLTEERIAMASNCFNNPPRIFDESGRLPSRSGLDGDFRSGVDAAGQFDSSTEHAGVPPECCHMHCGSNWYTCCGVISCCECQCCYPP